MTLGRVLVMTCTVVFAAGCAVNVGGPSPVDKDIAVVNATANMTADQVAQQLTQSHVEFGILAGPHDSAFYADVAKRANLTSTRPGRAGATTFAFIGPKAIGDTTLTLTVQGGGELRVHDALYNVDKGRRLDLLAVRIEPNTNLQRSIQTLLTYVASDVMANAAVLLAIQPPTPALGDSVSVLVRAAFSDLWECTKEGKTGARAPELPLRIFYGPAVRMRCESADVLNNGSNTVVGHFVLPR